MIRILIPKNNIKERSYIVDILFDEFLGLEYEINTCSDNVYQIVLPNENKIIIEDHFFDKYPKCLSYLRRESIPQQVIFVKNDFITENDIPVIYGNDKLKVSDNRIICGIDIFASSFFMLTRWEEYVNKTRDRHNRFPANESLAFRNDFLQRPVVNEYVEMLWKMLVFMGLNQIRKNRYFKLLLTHDVDVLFKYYKLKNGIKEFTEDLFKKSDLKIFFKHLGSKVKTHLNIKKDPYDEYDFLMSLSESLNIRSYFFFMVKGNSKYDAEYRLSSGKFKSVVENIKQRGHNIGIHPSYNAYNDIKRFSAEKKELEKEIGRVVYGREHFLRFEVPVTWQIWEDNSMVWDSTMGYAEKSGFRCGVCYEYSVFNILTREKLKLKEMPLLVMDGTYITYDIKGNENEIELDVKTLIKKAKKYKGNFVTLWHNSIKENISVWNVFKRVFSQYRDNSNYISD